MPLVHESSGTKAELGSSDTVVIPAPAGIQDDDLLLLLASMTNGLADPVTLPSGFLKTLGLAEVDHSTGSPVGVTAFKIASAESGPYTVTFSIVSGIDKYGAVLRISGANLVTPINIAANVEVEDAGAPFTINCPDVVTTVDGCLIVRAAYARHGTDGGANSISGVTATEIADFFSTGDNASFAVYVEDALQVAKGSTGIATITNAGVGTYFAVGWTIAIAPALGGSGGNMGGPIALPQEAMERAEGYKVLVPKGARIKNPVRRIEDAWKELRRK